MASSTQKKTTTKKSGSRSGSRTAKGKQPQKRPIRREVGGVILLVLALCVLVSYCGVQAILIDLLAKLLKGLFGYGYWLAGPAMLLAGGILLLHRGRPVTLRATCALLLPLLAGALFHTIFAGGDYALNGWGVLKNLWTAGLALKAGGAVSGLLAEAAVLAVSKVVFLFLFGLLLAVLLLPPLLVRLPALLRALLGTRRKVLFIVASEVVYGRFVDFDGSPGHVLDVLYDHFVVGMLLIVFVALGTHVAGQIVHRSGHGPPVGTPGQRPDHPLDVFAVMLVGDPPLRIGHRTGRNGQFLPRGTRVGTVHIQLEIRHDKQMVPEFVGEIRRVAQQRVQVAHDGDDGPRLTVAFAPVLYLQQRVDHLLDMAPVFGQVQLASRVIVILLHIAVSVPHTVPFGPPEPPAGPSR